MFPTINPTQTPAWQALAAHHLEMKRVHMKELFASDPDRFDRFSVRFEELLLDFSKNIITDKTLSLLRELAVQTGLPDAIKAMFSGEVINKTEDRAVLRIALRNRSNRPILDHSGDGSRAQTTDQQCVLSRVRGVLWVSLWPDIQTWL